MLFPGVILGVLLVTQCGGAADGVDDGHASGAAATGIVVTGAGPMLAG